MEVEREETINNTGGKTERRMTEGVRNRWLIAKVRTVRDSFEIFTFVATFFPSRLSNTRGF